MRHGDARTMAPGDGEAVDEATSTADVASAPIRRQEYASDVRDHLPKLFILLILALLVLAGAWGYASYDLSSRISDFTSRAQELSYARGGRLPDEAAARAHVTESAESAGVELSELAVEVHDEAGLDAAGKILNHRAAAMHAPSVRMTMRRYHFTARLSAHRWLWSRDRALDFTLSKRGRVELVLPPRTR